MTKDAACEYDLFDSVKNGSPRMDMVVVERKPRGKMFLKLVRTGSLATVHHDYGVGYLVVKIYTHQSVDRPCRTRLWFATIDDGDYGAWGPPGDFNETESTTQAVAALFRNMDTLPDESTINELLKPFKLHAGHE